MRLAFDSTNSVNQTPPKVGMSQSNIYRPEQNKESKRKKERKKILPKLLTWGIGLGFVLFVLISVFVDLGIRQNKLLLDLEPLAFEKKLYFWVQSFLMTDLETQPL